MMRRMRPLPRSPSSPLWLSAGILVLCGLALTSCRPSPITSRREVRVGIEARPQTLDPRYAWDAYGMRICKELLFSTLVRDGYDLRPEPVLATDWETPDPTTYVFHLRKGVSFHDGSPLSAADVVATFEHVLDPQTRSPYAATLAPVLERVQQRDELSVVFTLSQPVASFLSLVTVPILPRHLVDHADKDLSAKLIGSGPFRFVSQTATSIVLEPNPDCFEGAPDIDRLVFKVVGDDSTRFLKARKGELDLLINSIPLERIDDFRTPPLADTYRVVEQPGVTYQYLVLNLDDPVLGDLRVRRALAHAIDVKAIITHRLHDHAEPAGGLLAPVSWYHNPQVPLHPFDPELSGQLLDQAGFPDPDGAGGEPRLRLQLKTSTNPEALGTIMVLQAQLAVVGIETEVRSYEWGTYYADVKAGRFQVASMRWVGVTEPDFYYDIFHSGQLPPAGRNRGRYCNPQIDRLVELGRRSLDPEERRRAYRQVQEIVARDLPYISLWHVNNIAIVHRRIAGYRQHPKGNYHSFRHLAIAQQQD